MLTLHLLLLLAAPPAPSDPKSSPPASEPAAVVLKRGEQRLSPLKHANRCNCENKLVADGLLIDGRIELKGIGPGTTRCSLAGPNAASVIQVTVQK